MNLSQKNRFSDALARLAGDEDMLLMLAEIATEDAPPMIARLEEQLTDRELLDASKTAHAMKGLLSSFETGAPTNEIQPLIDAARGGNATEATLLFETLKPRLGKLCSEIYGLVGSNELS